MSTMSLRLPNSLHKHVKKLAEEEGVSINQLVSTAVAEKVAVLESERLLIERGNRGSLAKYRRVLAKVPARKPASGDEV